METSPPVQRDVVSRKNREEMDRASPSDGRIIRRRDEYHHLGSSSRVSHAPVSPLENALDLLIMNAASIWRR